MKTEYTKKVNDKPNPNDIIIPSQEIGEEDNTADILLGICGFTILALAICSSLAR